jgi:GDP-L-fucose synthase
VDKVIFLGSSCIYPRDSLQPISEDYLLSGPLELTNRPYAIAKISGIESVWSYNRQYQKKWLALMPTNLYGFGDNYHLEHSHVLPALMRRIHEAKINNETEVTVWGTGSPRREFLFADELGDAVRHLLTLDDEIVSPIFNSNQPPIINVGTGNDISIKELALILKEIIGFKGSINFDSSKPDGTPRKLLNVEKLAKLGWKSKSNLVASIADTYSDFINHNNRM